MLLEGRCREKNPAFVCPKLDISFRNFFCILHKNVKAWEENAICNKSYDFGQSETVPINLVILKMQFLVQFQIKIFACSTMFGIETISNLYASVKK